MTRPCTPHTFRTGETLDPERLRENFEQIAKDLADATEKRFGHSELLYVWSDLDETSDAAVRSFNVKLPFAWEIIGRSLTVYGTEDETFTLTSDTQSDGWEDMSVVAQGTTEDAQVADARGVTYPANTEVVFTVDSAASAWDADVHLLLQIREDRHAGVEPGFDIPRIDASQLNDPADLNTAISDISTAVTTNGTNDSFRRAEVVQWPNDISTPGTSNTIVELPDLGDQMQYIHVGVVAAATRGITVHVEDETDTSQMSASPTPGGASSLDVADSTGTDTQPGSGIDTAANNYRARLAATGSGTINRLYAIIVWQE